MRRVILGALHLRRLVSELGNRAIAEKEPHHTSNFGSKGRADVHLVCSKTIQKRDDVLDCVVKFDFADPVWQRLRDQDSVVGHVALGKQEDTLERVETVLGLVRGSFEALLIIVVIIFINVEAIATFLHHGIERLSFSGIKTQSRWHDRVRDLGIARHCERL